MIAETVWKNANLTGGVKITNVINYKYHSIEMKDPIAAKFSDHGNTSMYIVFINHTISLIGNT